MFFCTHIAPSMPVDFLPYIVMELRKFLRSPNRSTKWKLGLGNRIRHAGGAWKWLSGGWGAVEYVDILHLNIFACAGPG